MARRLRMGAPGFYHVLNRGVAKGKIFLDEGDYRKFLRIIDDASREFDFRLFDCCLMPNHYHLLLRTGPDVLSGLMQRIGARYSIYFNKRYDRVGPLWQGRFTSAFVHNEAYLGTLVRYIELNPVKAGLCDGAWAYPWVMSFPAFRSWFVSPVLDYGLLGGAPGVSGIPGLDLEGDLTPSELDMLAEIFDGRLSGGDGGTAAAGGSRSGASGAGGANGASGASGDPSASGAGGAGGAGGPPTLDQVFAVPRGMGEQRGSRWSWALDEAIVRALRAGYSAKELAVFLGISGAAVSKRMKRYRERLGGFEGLGGFGEARW